MMGGGDRLDEEEKFRSIYDKITREELLDDDEIDPWEAAFMQGWDDAE